VLGLWFEKWSLHLFLTTVPQQADVAGSILLFFYKKKTKQNKKIYKILPTTSACCGAVVRNECIDHFSCRSSLRKLHDTDHYSLDTDWVLTTSTPPYHILTLFLINPSPRELMTGFLMQGTAFSTWFTWRWSKSIFGFSCQQLPFSDASVPLD
jgi:hypothetical protein